MTTSTTETTTEQTINASGCPNCCRSRTPTGNVKLNKVEGLLMKARLSEWRADCCVFCAEAAYQDIQWQNLTLGWWGVLFPMNLYALARNWLEIRDVRKRLWPATCQYLKGESEKWHPDRQLRQKPNDWDIDEAVNETTWGSWPSELPGKILGKSGKTILRWTQRAMSQPSAEPPLL